jgi:hypothetical protein
MAEAVTITVTGLCDEQVMRDLLVLLHDVGAQLAMSGNRVEHYWGLHLLEDWRGLELLAHRAEVQTVVKDAAQ